MNSLTKLNQLGFALHISTHPEEPQLTRFTACVMAGSSAYFTGKSFDSIHQDIATEALSGTVYATQHFNTAIQSLLIRVQNRLQQDQ
jgi:hypothetical protein